MSFEIRTIEAREVEAVANLCLRAFLKDQPDHLPEYFLRDFRYDPYYRPEQTFVLFVEGEMVSTLSIFPREICLEGAVVKIGGIGNVATHPDFHKKGYAGMLLERSKELMRERGMDFSMLYGKESYYSRFGWATLPTKKITARGANDNSESSFSEIAGEEELHEVARIYEEDLGLQCGIKRTLAYWQRYLINFRGDYVCKYKIYLVHRKAGIIGYFLSGSRKAGETETIIIYEICSRPRQKEKVLRAIGKMAGERLVEFRFYSPEMLDLISCIFKEVFVSDFAQGLMVLLISPEELSRKIGRKISSTKELNIYLVKKSFSLSCGDVFLITIEVIGSMRGDKG